ncbi:MAG: Rap1a/Tai family immunity protein [Microvirga sp.]
MRITAALAVLIPLQAGAAGPDSFFVSGNELHSMCSEAASTNRGVADRTVGLGYVAGVFDYYKMIGGKTVCLPEHATAGQVRDVVCRYVREHPEERHETAAWSVRTALEEAFPCR